MKRWWLPVCLLFVAAAGSPARGADSPGQPPRGAESATDVARLIADLRAAGVSAEPDAEVEQPFFSVTGRMIKVRGEDVQVFEYPDVAAAEAQAALISRDGAAVGTAKPHWIGPPHFYKRGKLLALYLGDNDKVLKALEAVLGPQFAGK